MDLEVQQNRMLTPFQTMVLDTIPKTALADWAKDMESRGYMVRDNSKALVMVKKIDNEHRDDFIKRTVMHIYRFAHNKYVLDDIYYCRVDEKAYRRVSPDKREIRDIVVSVYDKFFGITPSKAINSTIDNITNNITEEAQLDNGVWFISNGLFWDSDKLEFVDADSADTYPFREINATVGFTDKEKQLLKDSFERHKSLLEPYEDKEFEDVYKNLPMEFDFIKVWADKKSLGFVDKYWDIMCSYATLFMLHKPPKAYFLIGNARGGKSSMINTLHYIVGDKNSARVSINNFANWSQNNSLFCCMLNAPDEDPATKIKPEALANFKSITAHSPTPVDVKGSSVSLTLRPDFISFFPKNSLPNWGEDSDACMKRCCPIMFTNDLSKLDHKPKDFVAETFTPSFTAEFLGAVLSLTWFLDSRKKTMFYSRTMTSSTEYISETINSTALFYKDFRGPADSSDPLYGYYKGLDGYESFQLLNKEYVNYCRANGYEIESQESLRQRFFIEGNNKKDVLYNDKKIHVMLSNEKHNKEQKILCRHEYITGLGTVEQMVANGDESFIEFLKNEAKALKERDLQRVKEFEGLGK